MTDVSQRTPFSTGLVAAGAIALVLLASAGACAGGCVLLDDDVRRAYPSPEVHEHVSELDPASTRAASPAVRQDFDGDGVVDHLDVEYLHMEPLLARATSGMVYVWSGATREVLFAHAVANPMIQASWWGDVDGNGTDDVRVEDAPAVRVFGRDARH